MSTATDRRRGTTQEGQHIEGWLCQCGHRQAKHRIFTPVGKCEVCDCEKAVWVDMPPLDAHRRCRGKGVADLLVTCRACGLRKADRMAKGQEVQRMQLARVIAIHNKTYPDDPIRGYTTLLRQYQFEVTE